jgi:putative transposase
VKFGFVAKHRGVWPVGWLCEALGVSRSGFHAWLSRPPSPRAVADAALTAQVRASFVASEPFQKLMADNGVACSMSRSGNVWDNAAMESFFSSLKTERTARKVYRTRNQARADVFDYIELIYNPQRRHSTIGYLSPMEFERIAAAS